MTTDHAKIELPRAPRLRSSGRYLAFVYGLASYALSVATLLYTIGFVANSVVSKTIDSGPDVPCRRR
jgi:hypothetical protein